MKTQSVLIVDDDEAVRSLLRVTLPTDGFVVLEAQDGTAALELTSGNEPDLVLLDWHLPGPSGSEVLEELHRTRPALPVIVLTVESRDRERELAHSLGAAAFLTKPFSPLELLDTIGRLLSTESDPSPR